MRIELTTSAWKAEVLPLNYTRIKMLFCQHRFDVSNITCIFFFRQGNVKKFVEKKFFFCPHVNLSLHFVKNTIQYKKEENLRYA